MLEAEASEIARAELLAQPLLAAARIEVPGRPGTNCGHRADGMPVATSSATSNSAGRRRSSSEASASRPVASSA